MNCDDDYVNKLEKYKCLVNTIDGNIFNKHNDQEKKTLVKRIFFTCMEFNSILTSVLISSCNFDVEKNSLCVYVSYEYTVTSLVSCCARIVNQNKWPTLLHDRADVTVGYVILLLVVYQLTREGVLEISWNSSHSYNLIFTTCKLPQRS